MGCKIATFFEKSIVEAGFQSMGLRVVPDKNTRYSAREFSVAIVNVLRDCAHTIDELFAGETWALRYHREREQLEFA